VELGSVLESRKGLFVTFDYNSCQ